MLGRTSFRKRGGAYTPACIVYILIFCIKSSDILLALTEPIITEDRHSYSFIKTELCIMGLI
jgi:hypothetical protein